MTALPSAVVDMLSIHVLILAATISHTTRAAAGHQHLKSTCDQGDTEWNRILVGAHLRYWLSSIELKDNKSPLDFMVEFKHGVKTPKITEAQTRFEFIVKMDQMMRPKGPAWKSFGSRGPRYHDGFLYGKLDESREMTGKANTHQTVAYYNPIIHHA